MLGGRRERGTDHRSRRLRRRGVPRLRNRSWKLVQTSQLQRPGPSSAAARRAPSVRKPDALGGGAPAGHFRIQGTGAVLASGQRLNGGGMVKGAGLARRARTSFAEVKTTLRRDAMRCAACAHDLRNSPCSPAGRGKPGATRPQNFALLARAPVATRALRACDRAVRLDWLADLGELLHAHPVPPRPRARPSPPPSPRGRGPLASGRGRRGATTGRRRRGEPLPCIFARGAVPACQASRGGAASPAAGRRRPHDAGLRNALAPLYRWRSAPRARIGALVSKFKRSHAAAGSGVTGVASRRRAHRRRVPRPACASHHPLRRGAEAHRLVRRQKVGGMTLATSLSVVW